MDGSAIYQVDAQAQLCSPDKIPTLSDEDLKQFLSFFSEVQIHVPPHAQRHVALVRDRISQLKAELDTRQNDQRGEIRHREAIGQGSKILFWARFAVLVGVVVPILVALIAEIPLSKLLPSTTSQPSPIPMLEVSATVSPQPTPTVVESPSESPQASPTPEVTSTPTVTPIKFPPPAP